MFKIQVTDSSGVEQIAVIVNDASERDAWINSTKDSKRFGDDCVFSITDLAPEIALQNAQAAKEKTNAALRLVAKQKINDCDLSQISDPVVRELLSNIRLLLSKWN